MNRTVTLFLALGCVGCSTTLSSLQTAKTLDPGQVRISIGEGVYIPVTQGVNAISQGIDLTARTAEQLGRNETPVLTAKDEQDWITSGLALAIFPPSAQFEAMVRVGIINNLDLGLKYSTNALRLDGRYRLFHSSNYEERIAAGALKAHINENKVAHFFTKDTKKDSTDITLGVGVSKYLFKSPVVELLQYVKLGDFNRWDLDGTLYISRDFLKYFGIYGTVKYVFSTTEADQNLVRFSEVASEIVSTDFKVPAQVTSHFLGGTFGLRAGIPEISVFLEITAGNTWATARVLDVERSLGGVTLYPAIGLASAFN